MRPFTDKEILDRVEQLDTFKGWKKGVYDIWVRSSADEFDKFDDKAFTYQSTKDGERPKFFMSRSGTTNAGSYGLKNFQDYNHEGCAVLKADHMIYGSHTYGPHPLRKGKPAYRQAKSWPYFRDNNRNNKAEEIGPEKSGIIGANIHRAGVDSTVIKNWSTACLVTANLSKFLAFLAFMKEQGNPPLNVAILKEANIGKHSAATSNAGGGPTVKQGQDSATESSGDSEKLPPTINQQAENIINAGDMGQNQQDINKPAKVEEAKPYNDIGLKQTLINDAKPLLPTNGIFQFVSDYAQQATGWPPWVIAWIGKAALILLIVTIAWILYRFIAWGMHSWRENERVKLTAQINSDPTRKDLHLTPTPQNTEATT